MSFATYRISGRPLIVHFDVKLTGAKSVLGLNGPTMRTYLSHARAVLLAARKEGCRVGQCRAVAFLVRRPPGETFDGGLHRGSFGFVAIDTDVLVAWEPKTAKQAPATISMCGGLLQRAAAAEPEALPYAPPPARPPPRDRWYDLEQVEVKPGWVTTQDFCRIFKIGQNNRKHGANRVHKRLRDDGAVIDSWKGGGRGPPFKIARISALKTSYKRLE